MRDAIQSLAGAVFPTPTHYLATCGVLLVAQTVYMLFGFGAGLVAVGALAMVLPQLGDAVVLLLFVGLPAEIFVVATNYREISWRGVALICVGIGAGIPAGTALLKLGEPTLVLGLLGILLVAVGIMFLFLREGLAVRWPSWSAPVVGAVSGVLAGLFGTGGPPLVLYYRLAGVTKTAFRGNLMSIFLVISLLRLPSYGFAGLLSADRLGAGFLVLPAVFLGAWLGQRIHLDVGERTFARLVAGALVIIGLLLFVRLR
jgi:uncharacterized membrane protein YfcA